MNREDIHKLLGGYATGTLTPEEQQALFEAALNDQELFDALAREQSLRDLLREPTAKAWLLAALDQKPVRWYQTMWGKVVAWGVPLATATLAVLVWYSGREQQPTLVARVNPPSVASPVGGPPATPAGPVAEDRRAEEPKAPGKPLPDGRGSEKAASEKAGSEKAASEEKPASVPELDQRELQKQKPLDTERKDLAEADRDKVARQVAALPLNGRTLNQEKLLNRPAASPPPPPAPQPKSEAAPSPPVITTSQSSNLQQVAQAPYQQTAQQGQQGQQGGVAGALPTRASQPAGNKPETVQVQAAAATVDTLSGADAKSRYYATGAAVAPAGMAGGGGGANFGAARTTADGSRKKAATPAEQTLTNSKVDAPHALNLGVRYALSRKTATGAFDLVDPNRLQIGDTLELQLKPNESGTLRVRTRGPAGLWREALSQTVEAAQDYIVALNSGDTEVQVTLTRLATTSVNGFLRDEVSSVQRQPTTELATYVVTGPSARQLQFSISLNYK